MARASGDCCDTCDDSLTDNMGLMNMTGDDRFLTGHDSDSMRQEDNVGKKTSDE